MSRSIETHKETIGLIYGFLGVLIFSGTLPATRIAVTNLNPTFVGLGRALVASVLAAILLHLMRQPLPSPKYWRSLLIVVAGVIVGFPVLSAWAMQQLPASHGAIVTGLAPLATAIAGAFRAGERPTPGFWLASFAGSVTIVLFALITGNGSIQFAHLALLGAVITAGIGYAEGGKLARILGGWQVICWALVIAAPVLSIPVSVIAVQNGLNASPSAWLGFGYVSVFSMFLGFFAWYRGLAMGGIAVLSYIAC